MSKLFEQGDVLIFSTDEIPTGNREIVDSGILASGEATGHHHRVAPQVSTWTVPAPARTTPTLYRVDGVLYVEAPMPFRVTHEEHKPIDVPAGKYRVGLVQEYDYDIEESRNVAD